MKVQKFILLIHPLFSTDTKAPNSLYISFQNSPKYPSHPPLSLSFPEPFVFTLFCVSSPLDSAMALLPSKSTPLFSLLFLVTLQCHVASSALLLSLKHHQNSIHHQRPMIHANQSNCALFVGTWVRDDTYPLYQPSSCPMIDPQFNCKMYGRPDSDYLKYRWRPLNCELPRYTPLPLNCKQHKSSNSVLKIAFFLFCFCILSSEWFCSVFLVGSMGLSFWWEWRAKPSCLWVTHWGAINGSHWYVWYMLQCLRHKLNWSGESHSQPSDSWWAYFGHFLSASQ